MKKNIFFILLMMLVCVFANAQTVSERLEKANENYLFGTGAYELNGSDGPRTVNVFCDSPIIGDIETGETVKVLVTFDSPAENWDVLIEPTLAEISYSGVLSQYVFEIILVAGNTLGNDTFKLVGDGEIELTFDVVAPKKNFTVTANDVEIDLEEPLNLNEFSGNGFVMKVYDDQDEMLKTTQFTFVDPVPVEGDIVVSRQKQMEYINVYKSSGSGKAKIEIKKEGYNDFVFYVTYTEPKKDFSGVFDGEKKIDKESTIELTDNGIRLSVYDGVVIKNYNYDVTFDQISGNLEIGKVNDGENYKILSRTSGYGKSKVTVSADGYNDFVFYAEYKKDFTVTDPNGNTLKNGDTFTLTNEMKGQDLTITIDSTLVTYTPLTVEGEMPITIPIWSYGTDSKSATFKMKDPAVSGKFQMKFTQEGYNDFVFYLEYTVPEPTGIKMTPRNKTINGGETFKITASVLPAEADQTLTWKSTNSAVATVDKNGVVKGIKKGTVYIKATTSNGITLSCKVTVVIYPDKLILNNRNLDMCPGKKFTVKATVSPDNATDKTVTWKSSNPKAATVDQNGTITAVALGTTYIKATTSNGITVSCKVNVVKPVKATGIKMTPRNKTIKVGETFTIKAVPLPELSTNDVITWKSSNSKVATVDKNGKVKGIKAGGSYIKATVNGITISCKLTVK